MNFQIHASILIEQNIREEQSIRMRSQMCLKIREFDEICGVKSHIKAMVK